MNLDDVIIQSSYEEEKEIDEETVMRMQYEKAYPEDYVGDTVLIDSVHLSPMFSEMKTSKKGKEYQSNKCVLTLFNDEDETQINFWVENFKNYNENNDRLIVEKNNPLAKLLVGLSEDDSNNHFVITYEALRTVVEKIGVLKVKIYEYDRNGFSDYSIKVLGYQLKR